MALRIKGDSVRGRAIWRLKSHYMPPPDGGLLHSRIPEEFLDVEFISVGRSGGRRGRIAWYNNTHGEIGDECAPAAGVATGTVSLNGHIYGIQKEYSNYSHACKYSK